MLTNAKIIYSYTIIYLIAFGFGCQMPERPRIIVVANPIVFRPKSPDDVRTVQDSIAAVITICRDDLSLPTPARINILLYKNTVSFAFYGKGWTTLPTDVANLVAFARGNSIHINLEKLGEISWGAALPWLAHEYAHVISYSDAQDKSRMAKWFEEGFSEWVAAKVMDALGWQTYDISVHRAQRELAHYLDAVPVLSSLSEERDWEYYLQKPKGSIRTYNLAFLAVDRLIEDDKLPAALRYMQSGNFENAFRRSLESYSAETSHFLSALVPLRKIDFNLPQPKWKVGFFWIYEEKVWGKITKLRKEIIREELTDGIPTFVLNVGSEEQLFTKRTLGLLATSRNGKTISKREKANEMFSWPLTNGKEWRNVFKVRYLESNESGLINRMMVVNDMRPVKVPAGTFQTVKIEAFDTESDRLVAEYWYSPVVMWFVKIRTYGVLDGSLREQQLLTFNVDEN